MLDRGPSPSSSSRCSFLPSFCSSSAAPFPRSCISFCSYTPIGNGSLVLTEWRFSALWPFPKHLLLIRGAAHDPHVTGRGFAVSLHFWFDGTQLNSVHHCWLYTHFSFPRSKATRRQDRRLDACGAIKCTAWRQQFRAPECPHPPATRQLHCNLHHLHPSPAFQKQRLALPFSRSYALSGPTSPSATCSLQPPIGPHERSINTPYCACCHTQQEYQFQTVLKHMNRSA